MTKSSATENGLHEATITLLNHGGSDSTIQCNQVHDSKGASSRSQLVRALVSATAVALFLLTLLVTEFVRTGSYPGWQPSAAEVGRSKTGLSSFRRFAGSSKVPVGCAESFNMNAEVNNLRGFQIDPECGEILAQYMDNKGGWYGDFGGAIQVASDYFKTIRVHGDGLDVVVMGIDETALSNMEFFRKHKYGGEEYNETVWNEWVHSKKADAHPEILKLYKELRNAKVGIIFVSARSESQRDVTAENLIAAGYDQGWEGLILRQSHQDALTNKDFKSLHRVQLERKGYRILFNIGDQWSDLEGPPENRGFKLSNPMYYRY